MPNIETDIFYEKIFHVDDAEVVVDLYDQHGIFKITLWLNGVEELTTVNYEGSLSDDIQIEETMKKIVEDNREYILDIYSNTIN